MINYELYIPTRIVYGQGKHKEVGRYLKPHTSKVLLVYGGGSVKRTGLYDAVVESLKQEGIEWMELGGVKSNPTLEKVNEGIRICRENDIRFLLAVGGGSVIDTAKTIAFGFDYEGDVWDFYAKKVQITHALPIGTILTIPGTASEVSKNTVLTNEHTQEKIGILHECLRPVFSILDPTLCLTIPKNQIANGVYDAFCHTLERYMDPIMHTDVIDGIAEGVMKGLLKNGSAVYKNQSDVDAWGEIMIGSNFAHNSMTGFGRKGDWANHPMEEVVSGIYDIPHGAGLSIITPAWMRYIYKKHLPIFVQFAVNVMGVSGPLRDQERIALEGIEKLEEFSRKMGLPLHLSELNIDDSQLEFMAKRCASYQKDGRLGQLEKLSWEDILEIYRLAL